MINPFLGSFAWLARPEITSSLLQGEMQWQDWGSRVRPRAAEETQRKYSESPREEAGAGAPAECLFCPSFCPLKLNLERSSEASDNTQSLYLRHQSLVMSVVGEKIPNSGGSLYSLS